jgi:hypothetical protein
VRSGAPKVVAIDPENALAPPSTVIESAPASTPLSSPGGVAPPDQVIEARLALAVATAKLVKVNVPAGVVSKCVLPVVLMTSMTGCEPAPGVSTGTITGGLSSVT